MIQKSKSVSPMSNEGRNAYVIEHINEALLGLLKEKSLNEISIRDMRNCRCRKNVFLPQLRKQRRCNKKTTPATDTGVGKGL